MRRRLNLMARRWWLRVHIARSRMARRPEWLFDFLDWRARRVVERRAQPGRFWLQRYQDATTEFRKSEQRDRWSDFLKDDYRASALAAQRIRQDLAELQMAASLGSTLAIRRIESLRANWFGQVASEEATEVLSKLSAANRK